MLKSLEIKNVALIDSIIIDFSQNLNVLTGETGAGKSIIIDSLNFVIGAKANKSLIKQGKDFMKVVAVFSGPFSNNLTNMLEQYDVESSEEILISRKLTIDGKNDIRVNGSVFTSAMLKNITNLLIDIHGQHEHQQLLDDKNHLSIIDSFIKDNSIFQKYTEKLVELKTVESLIKKLNGSTENQERILDLLDYQIKEIDNAKLIVGEDDDLVQKRTAMLNYEKIFDNLDLAISNIDGQTSIIDSLKKAHNSILSIVKFDDSFEALSSRLESSRYELLDILEVLRDKKSECNFNQNEFDLIDERLDKIKILKKKYGSTIEDVLNFSKKSKEQYNEIVNSKEILEKKLKEKELILDDLYEIATQINALRQEISNQFEKKVQLELNDLGMKNSKFKVDFSKKPDRNDFDKYIKNNGFDSIKFLFSANAGQNLKPLSEIISGGEASRFMLALKNILAENDEISSMVFDEIDTGISGDMGYKVACKLANISKKHQVMSVSHLPQICAMADANFKISKFVENDNTYVEAVLLNQQESLKEVSRLSGGAVDSKISIQHAKELKLRCDNFKLTLK